MENLRARASPARPYVAPPHTVDVSAGKFEREFEHASSPRDRLRAQYAPSSCTANAPVAGDATAWYSLKYGSDAFSERIETVTRSAGAATPYTMLR